MVELINVSLCLSDIPKDRIKVAKNGKKYLSVVVSRLREPDAYENTHSVFVNQTKEERERKDPRKYIGKGKEVVFDTTPAPTPAQVDEMPAAEEVDDMPF